MNLYKRADRLNAGDRIYVWKGENEIPVTVRMTVDLFDWPGQPYRIHFVDSEGNQGSFLAEEWNTYALVNGN